MRSLRWRETDAKAVRKGAYAGARVKDVSFGC